MTNDSIGHKVISLNQSKESFLEGLSKLGHDILPCKTLCVLFSFFFHRLAIEPDLNRGYCIKIYCLISF